MHSELYGVGGKIFLYHERNLENNRVVEFTKVKTGKLLNFFKSVHEGISVYEKLS